MTAEELSPSERGREQVRARAEQQRQAAEAEAKVKALSRNLPPVFNPLAEANAKMAVSAQQHMMRAAHNEQARAALQSELIARCPAEAQAAADSADVLRQAEADLSAAQERLTAFKGSMPAAGDVAAAQAWIAARGQLHNEAEARALLRDNAAAAHQQAVAALRQALQRARSAEVAQLRAALEGQKQETADALAELDRKRGSIIEAHNAAVAEPAMRLATLEHLPL